MKRIGIEILDFIAYSNLFMSVCAFIFTLQNTLVLKLVPVHFILPFSYLVAASVFFIYGVQRMYQLIRKRNPAFTRREKWYLKNTHVVYFLLACSLAAIIFLVFYINWKLIFYFSPLLLISVLYFAGPLRLREIKGVKSFFVAFVWISSTLLVPWFAFPGQSAFNFFYVASQFCFIAGLCTPFDIRDYKRDKRENIRSLPVWIGIKGAKMAGMFAVLLFPVLMYFSGHQYSFYASCLTAFFSMLVIGFTRLRFHDYYYYFAVDGMIIMRFVFLILVLHFCGYSGGSPM
jgi:4-hydroxybenzoate polyprenyltransferase